LEAWIDEQLERLGLERIGEPEERRFSPWSRVLRVPASGGPVWAKAVAPGLRHEIAVTQALASLDPELVLAPLAADEERGFMLFPDGGETLRHAPTPGLWEQTLARYAQLQIDSAAHAEELLRLGALDRRPASLPDLYERLIAAEHDADRLRELAPRLEEACARLGSTLPVTIEHDDLHDGNVLEDGRIFDWGDAGVAHPFFTTVISLQEEPDRVRDAYLEPWTALASRAELLEILDDALWVGKAARALTWAEILSNLDEDARREYWKSVDTWLLLFLAGG
jgi:Ser/Thr protein kinase RdoA (MazF antagonist)